MNKPRVLVVEDEAIVAEHICDRLQVLGYETLATAASGEKAVQAAVEMRPDLVLMDIRLKGEMDGVEAAAEIAAQCDIPVVYLTAYGDEALLQRAKITEPFGYVVKPFEDPELRVNIEIALYKHEQERKLRESEERYRQLVELSPDAIAVHSEGKIVYINPAGARLLGAASSEQLIGKPVMDFLHPDYRDMVKERIGRVSEEREEAPLIEEEFVRLDGTVVDAEVAAIPFTYQGRPAVQAIARDITERKRAQEALREHVRQVERLNELFLGREHRMIELKREVNSLLDKLGERPKYESPAQVDELRKEAREKTQ
jgi:PAS domain S-box-containing protein